MTYTDPKLTIDRRDACQAIIDHMTDSGKYKSLKHIIETVKAMGNDEIIKILQRMLRPALGHVDITLL